ncbi:MAG: C39 family peptidase [Bacilli bacterium]|nr:C39 family peptidase [Bacilli bacterium]
MTKKKKTVIIVVAAVVATLSLAVAIPFSILGIRTASISGDYSYLREDEKYSSKVEITNIDLVTQHISCGYATIEMMSTFYGNTVTEDQLSDKNKGAISTSSSDGFLKEINKSIPTKKFAKRAYLRNDKLLKEIHDSLENNNPVAIEWAALYEGKTWTLHFSLISGLDIANDNVTVYNPYGYIENITVKEFIDRSTFNAYKNMEFFLAFGFAFGAFEKNTIFYAK